MHTERKLFGVLMREHGGSRLLILGVFLAVVVIAGLRPITAVAQADPHTTSLLESLGTPIDQHHIPTTNMWPEGNLLYGQAVISGTNMGPFFVFDVVEKNVVYSGDTEIGTGFRNIMVDGAGNAYFSAHNDGLARYDPTTNSVEVLEARFPSGGFLRASTRESERGWIYGATRKPDMIFRFNPQTQVIEEIGALWGYTTHMVLDPSGRYVYYLPDAHGSAYQLGAPVLQFDVQSRTHKVIAFLNNVFEPEYGFRIGGTYALDIDPTGNRLFINLNAVDLTLEPDAEAAFGNPVVVMVEMPAPEAVPRPPRFAFEDVAAEFGLAESLSNAYVHTASWGDVNDDGQLDLLVGSFVEGPATTPNKLLLNQGGSFHDAGQPQLEIRGRASGSVFADFDNDGDLDLFVSNNRIGVEDVQGEPSRLFRNDEGTFVDVTAGSGIEAQSSNGRQVGVLDFDGDGLLDIFVVADSLRGTGPTVLLKNLDGLRFEDHTVTAGIPTDIHGLGLAIGDVTGNGWPDIFVAGAVDQSQPNGNFLLIANGDGSYRQYPNDVFDWTPFTVGDEDWVSGASLADLNRDGRLDLVVGHHFGSAAEAGLGAKLRVYMNRATLADGDPVFEDITDASGLPPILSKAPHVEVQDFDNDGWPDIGTSVSVDSSTGPAPLIFFHSGGNGDPTFSLPSDIASMSNPHYHSGGPSADFDGDGRLDIFLSEWRAVLGAPAAPKLMQNQGAPGNWLQVKVVGNPARGENRFGVGATVEIYRTGSKELLGMREISPAFGWSSSQPAIAHFGLGDDDLVDIVVRLPFGGATYSLEQVPANRLITIPDGSAAETLPHLGLETVGVTLSDDRFLTEPGGELPPHTLAASVPSVTFAVVDLPAYEGNPWSQWGAGLYASNGHFYAGIGDHHTIDGNSFLYEFDPITHKLKLVGDISSAIDHVTGSWGHGKIHGQITEGADGYLYFSTYRGSQRGIIFDENYRGSLIARYPVSVSDARVGSDQSLSPTTPMPVLDPLSPELPPRKRRPGQ